MKTRSRVRRVPRPQRRPCRLVKRLRVEAGDDRIVGRSGLHLLASFCETVGVDAAIRDAVEPKKPDGFFIQDRGRLVTHMAVAVASGASCLADIKMLADQAELFGDDLASDATVFRTFENDIDSGDWSRSTCNFTPRSGDERIRSTKRGLGSTRRR